MPLSPAPLRPAPLALALALAPGFARADDAVLRTWGVEDGLPQGTVTAISPDDHGFLLVGTFGGLARFDGEDFRRLSIRPEQLAALGRVTALARRGATLWVGLQDGGVWMRHGGLFSRPSQPDALARATVWSVALEDDGALLVASQEGAWRRSADGAWRPLRAGVVNDVDVGPDGSFWLTGAGGVERHSPDGRVRALGLDPGPGQMTAGAVDAAGRYWLHRGIDLVMVPPDGAPVQIDLGLTPDTFTPAPVVDPGGGLWIADQAAVLYLGLVDPVAAAAAAGHRLLPSRMGVRTSLRALGSDRAGEVWVGRVVGGLGHVRLSEDTRLRGPTADGTPWEGPVSGDAAGLWTVEGCATVVRSEGERRERVALPTPPGAECVTTLRGVAPGRALVGLEGGVFEVRAGAGPLAAELVWGPDSGLGPGPVTTVEPLPDGRVLVGGAGGLLALGQPGGPLTRLDGPDELGLVLDLLPIGDDLWAAGTGGLWRRRDGSWSRIRPEDGFLWGGVRALAEGPDKRIYAAGYGGGLGWTDGVASGRAPVGEGGLLDTFLSGLHFDANGNLWLQGNAGVQRVGAEGLAARVAGLDVPLDTWRADVGEASGYRQPSLYADAGGALWLSTVRGLMRVPLTDPGPSAAAPVVVDGLWFGGRRFEGAVDAPAELHRHLRVEFSSPELRGGGALRHRWRVCVEGRPCPGWSTPSASKVAEVSAMSPGAHRFELQSLDLSGTPGPVTAVVIRVAPRWHERLPVRLLGGLLVVGLGVGLGGWRSRAVLRQNRRLRREVQRRVEIEAALQRQEAHYRGLFETEAVALLVLDASGCCVDANPRARELLGQEPLGRSRGALGLPPEPDGAPRALRLPVAGDAALPVLVRETALGPEGAGGSVVVLTDLRDREEAELEQARLRAELSAARRLDALGRLAGGVAHDLNNVLAAIAGSVELAAIAPDAGPEALREIQDAVRRGSGMVDRLLAFGRPGGEPAERVDPDEVADGMRRMLERLLPAGVQLRLELGAPGPVRMARCGLEQALLNLVVNACDALPRGGTITVRTRRVDGLVQIEVDDDGEGVDPALADRIFEPFVTSRPPGQGTGLGLATVRSVAVGAGGRALQLPRPGPGACFALRLPPAGPEPGPPAAAPAPAPPGPAARGGAGVRSVLLVDDDDAVRRSLARPLRRAGFAVHDVGSGEAALAWLRGGGDPQVMITDLGMDGMDGLHLADAARALRPSLPVLYISGGAGELRAAAARGATLLKPFTPRELQEQVLQLIDGPRTPPEAG